VRVYGEVQSASERGGEDGRMWGEEEDGIDLASNGMSSLGLRLRSKSSDTIDFY
jgi:hypothetical protein